MKNPMYKILGASGLALILTACGGSSRDAHPIEFPNLDDDQNGDTPEVTGEWQLVWSDEFEGDEIDTSKWSHEQNCWGGGNNELQCYTDRVENSYVEDGHLYIVAREETFSGPSVPDDHPSYNADDESVTRQYTSARLRTKDQGDWRYGRIEVNAKMPEGQGMWPAIWMLPTEAVYGGWPLSGEIDIFEAVNTNASGENEVHGTLHYGRPWPDNQYSGAAYVPEAPIWEEFHTYAIEWEEGEIRWYVDDEHYATQTDDGWYTLVWNGQNEGFDLGDNAAPFDEIFHLIMNVAVGGDWPGNPDGNTTFPQQMVVDYVRVYECDAGLDTGKGCATISEDAEHVEGNSGDRQIFDFYVDGPGTLNLSAFGNDVHNTLKPGQWEETGGNLVVDTAFEIDDQIVWDIQFNGMSNVFLTSGDMDDVDHVEDGLVFNVSQELSGIYFDMRVLDASDDAQLSVKIDSGWPNVSSRSIELPTGDDWQSVHVRFSDFTPNDDEPGQVSYGDVVNPFVLELSEGSAHVQVNNVHMTCIGESCGISPKLDGTVPEGTEGVQVYSDGSLADDWSEPGVDFYTEGGQEITSRTVSDSERGDVLEVSFGSSGYGTMYIQSDNPKDLRAYAGGNLEFDIKVVEPGANTDGFLVKADCVYPCSSNEIAVPMPDVGEWETISITLSELTSGSGFIMGRVNVPLSIWPVRGSQANVTFRLDNILWTTGE